MALSDIKNVFILMLENRSFDHLLGYSGITGRLATDLTQAVSIEGIDPASPPQIKIDDAGTMDSISDDGPFYINGTDPGHEMPDTLSQLTGNIIPLDGNFSSYLNPDGSYPVHLNNSGFVMDYQRQKNMPTDKLDVIRCFNPKNLPVLNALAKEFVVCDNWFSSLPGPTWPNRFFIHAASSGGLDHSPTPVEIASADFIDGYTFGNGTIYDQLIANNISWDIYAGSALPIALALKGVHNAQVRDYETFEADLSKPNFPQYCFIEPSYGDFITGNYRKGNSMHPLDDVTHGEALVKRTYEAIRNSPLWNNCLFIITFDEHGGFYDHVAPPANATAPGDVQKYNNSNFDFQQYGVRVPGIIISPLIEQNLIDKTQYDHTSVLATVERVFGLNALTNRDATANHFEHLFTLEAPRNVRIQLPNPADSGAPVEIAPAVNANDPIDPSLVGFAHLALIAKMQAAPPEDHPQMVNDFYNIANRGDAVDFMKSAV